MKTSRISRLIQILTVLQSEQNYGVESLAEISGIGKRMVFRDLNELRKAGVPLNFNRKKRYYKIDRGFFLPPPNLDEKEAFSLLMFAFKTINHIDFPFKNSALMAAIKIENQLPETIKRFCSRALQKISIKTESQEKSDLLDHKFLQLLKAILDERIVKISYGLSVAHQRIITIYPYHLMYNDYAWHIVGRKESNKKICILKFNHITELHILETRFIEVDKFDFYEYIGSAWSKPVLLRRKIRGMVQNMNK